MHAPSVRSATRNAFSLVEVLMVIAIISIMSALVINAFSNATEDTRDIVAHQQQAAIQSALDNWMSQQITGTATVATIKDLYNFKSAGAKRNSMERLGLIQDYLDVDTYNHFNAYTSDATKVRSAAMKKVDKYLVLTDWPDITASNKAPYPKVELHAE